MSAPVYDPWRLEEMPAPDQPAKGMAFWVQTGSHRAFGQAYTINRVNERSFYVSVDGGKQRVDRRDWWRWLQERAGEGTLLLDGHPLTGLDAEPLFACAQVPVGAPLALGADPGEIPRGPARPMEPRLRDARVFRAVRDVIERYRLTRGGPDQAGLLTVEVARPGAAYQVRIDPEWRRGPTCTCPDAARVRDAEGATWCKHVIAALLTDDDQRHQVLDLLL